MQAGVERITLSPPCKGQQPSRSLKLTGIEAGSVIQLTPGAQELAKAQRTTVQLQAIGSRETVSWLLDGRWVGTTEPARPSLNLPLPPAGAHALTAMDTQGRYEQVLFGVR
jgi:penicillin-binding protein 1C